MDLIEKYSLLQLYNKNDLKTQKIILNELNTQPRNIKDGYLYCFRPLKFVNTPARYKLKIGRTFRSSEKRIKEQNGKQLYSICSVFYFKLERMCHLFFRFANVRGINDGKEMFLFTKDYSIEMNEIFSYINTIDLLLKNRFSEAYKLTIPVEIDDTDDMDKHDEIIITDKTQLEIHNMDKHDEIIITDKTQLKIPENQVQIDDLQNAPYKRHGCSYTCTICNATFSILCNYERHLNNKNTCDPIKREQQKIDKLTCTKCKKVLSSKARLIHHVTICKTELTKEDKLEQIIDMLNKKLDMNNEKIDKLIQKKSLNTSVSQNK
jgi:hypothetical protein